jgi:hypothetical protein
VAELVGCFAARSFPDSSIRMSLPLQGIICPTLHRSVSLKKTVCFVPVVIDPPYLKFLPISEVQLPRFAVAGPTVRADALEKDASPPCSGHDGLTPGLGDREVKLAHAARRRAWAVGTARSPFRTKMSDDPSRGHPESPSPPASRLAPDVVHCGPADARIRRVLTLCVPYSCPRMRSWPPGRRTR